MHGLYKTLAGFTPDGPFEGLSLLETPLHIEFDTAVKLISDIDFWIDQTHVPPFSHMHTHRCWQHKAEFGISYRDISAHSNDRHRQSGQPTSVRFPKYTLYWCVSLQRALSKTQSLIST